MVPANMSPRIANLVSRRRQALNYLSSASRCWLTENGRTAFFQILRTLPEGDVLFPDYHCGIEIETALAADFRPVYYRIRRDLQPDLDDFERALRAGVSAAVVTHFNGFPQPVAAMRDICDRWETPLIEDCAHALRTEIDGRPLGTFGQFAVFSLRKFAPVPHGGVLVVNSPEVTCVPSLTPAPLRRITRDVFTVAREFVGRPIGRPPSTVERVHDFRSDAYTYDIGPVAGWIFERLDLPRAHDARRENYHSLYSRLSRLSELTVLYGPLARGVCPAAFMIECADPWQAAAELAARGTESYPFWTFFHSAYPFGQGSDAEYLKTHVLALPVHQNLKPEDMHRIADAVYSALEEPNGRKALCVGHHAVSK